MPTAGGGSHELIDCCLAEFGGYLRANAAPIALSVYPKPAASSRPTRRVRRPASPTTASGTGAGEVISWWTRRGNWSSRSSIRASLNG